jgi:hypothetical protein
MLLDQPRRLVNASHVRTDYRLLECSEDLLKTILKDGCDSMSEGSYPPCTPPASSHHHTLDPRVLIKGGQHDEAVLCTSNKTYSLKYVETTNMQLLIAPEVRRRRSPCNAHARLARSPASPCALPPPPCAQAASQGDLSGGSSPPTLMLLTILYPGVPEATRSLSGTCMASCRRHRRRHGEHAVPHCQRPADPDPQGKQLA